jgi:organic radical activating enzyme
MLKAKDVRITVEQFDNGITLRWKDLSGEYDSSANVVLKGGEPNAIGALIYEDIKQIMDSVPCNGVEVNICYTPIEKTE